MSDSSTKALEHNWSAGAGGRIAGNLGRDLEGQWANVGGNAPSSGDQVGGRPRGGVLDRPTRDDLPRTKQEKVAAVAALRAAMEHMTPEQRRVLDQYLRRAGAMRGKWAGWPAELRDVLEALDAADQVLVAVAFSPKLPRPAISPYLLKGPPKPKGPKKPKQPKPPKRNAAFDAAVQACGLPLWVADTLFRIGAGENGSVERLDGTTPFPPVADRALYAAAETGMLERATAGLTTPVLRLTETGRAWLRACMRGDAEQARRLFARAKAEGSIPRGLEQPLAVKSEVVMTAAIKAIEGGDEWLLDVLGCPYYGPNRGRDEAGEYFSPATNFYPEQFPLPPLVYYHGFDEHGRPAGAPVFLGKAISREERADGVWYRVALDKASSYARRIWEAAKRGAARASSGTALHLRRVAPDGHITHWPVVELSLMDTDGVNRRPCNSYAVAVPALKAIYEQAGLELPATIDEEPEMAGTAVETTNGTTAGTLTAADIQRLIADGVKTALAEQQQAAQAQLTAEQETQRKIEEAVKAARDELVADFVATKRLPDGANVPVVLKYAEVRRFDNLDAADQAVLIEVLGAAHESRASKQGVSDAALKALVIKLDEDKTRVGEFGRQALKANGIKANEVMQQSLVGAGRDWVGQAFSQAIWDRIRLESFVAANLPSIEVPQGADSITLPLEGADPTFYKVAEAASNDSTGLPAATVPSSKPGTDSRTLSVAKMGARVEWSGEMEEDSLIPFVPQLRQQLATAGQEQFEHAIIDGDTATAAGTNINDITAAGVQAATNLYLLFDGFRKLALVTNTANARAGAALALADFINTLKLMGVSGINALGMNRRKVGFIVDPLTYYAAMQLTQVQTRDLFSNPTIEGGELTGLYGVALKPSGFMCFKSGTGLSNASGKVDQVTPANNTKGSILAVRWDQFVLGYKRRMTTEVTRIARADVTEIICLMRVGLKNRDMEAAAITYNLTV